MRVVERLPASEILKLLDKQWLNTSDIKKLACVGTNKAIELRNAIASKVTNDDPNYFLPSKLVPTSAVVDYLHLDIKYLKKIANVKENKNEKI